MPLGINRRDQHPAPGVRGSTSGMLELVGTGSASWSVSVSDTNGINLGFGVTWLILNDANARGHGLPLRCLSE
ncbi:hypothetical protein [uncultured Rikenella sp.]|uniref:hypothetical protein n=2 Tax=uncultured Rikenella sp. TaxID=368003 RepID=UPI00260D348B|nr:hypothetical protein [uncultured Rikenella sp.]